MEINFLIVPLAALIPLFTGWLWYSKALFGKAWMKASNINPDEGKRGNMALIFLLTYVFSLLVAMALMPIVIHQMGLYSTLALDPALKDPNSETGKYMADFFAKYGTNYRTFKHGAFHGTLSGLFFAMPIIGIIALFEGRKFKYIAIHTGYWMLTLALMGGVICAFA